MGPRTCCWNRTTSTIQVTKQGRLILIELKTYPKASWAIREALGQILEYAFHKTGRRKGDVASLVIAALKEPDSDDSAYIELLRNEFGIPVAYCTVSLGMSVLPKELL